MAGNPLFLRKNRQWLNRTLVRSRFLGMLIAFGLAASSLASGADPHPDYAPLADLYNATNGSGWKNSDKWLTDNNPCGWYGVTCTGNRVGEIKLENNNLVGTIPATLGNLTSLWQLSLSFNQLSGEIPSSFGNLSNLASLSLFSNQLTGSIPGSLANLPNLISITLSFNQLTGEIPASLGSLTKLISLSLNDNKLIGEIPGSLGNLTKLTGLGLFNNKLSGPIPSSLGNLVNLQALALYNNELTGEIPGSLGNLINLDRFYADHNKLSGSIPESFGNMSKLRQIFLYNNELSGLIPGSLGNLTKLEYLQLFMNKLSGEIPASLGAVKSLQYLDLQDNQLSGTIPGSVTNLTNLKSLGLSNNKLTGIIPNDLGNLTSLGNLSLYGNELTGGIPNSLGNLINLQYLSLSNNKLSEEIPASLGNLTNLQYFFLEYNDLSGSIPSSLGNLTKLEYFSLYKNRLSGFIPTTLGNLIKLQNLYLSDNQFVGAVPSSLGNLTNLQSLLLHNNQLGGAIPASIGNLSNLQTLNANNNQLSGCFPASFMALCGRSVYFYNNPGLPGGGNFEAFCNQTAGSNTMSAPIFVLPSGIPYPILQNTPSVSLTVLGCTGGTLKWSGPNNTSGTGTTIAVPTSTTGVVVYSATCTVGSCVSPPGMTAQFIAPASVTGNFDGFVYGVDCETFRGWAWNRDKVNAVISVDILDGATVIATLPAGDFRQDLLNAGKGNGKHAFSFPIPSSLKDGRPHLLTARVAGSSFMLKNPPKALTCQGSGEPINQPPVAPTTSPLSATIGTAFSITLPVFTDPENQSLTYSLSGLPSGLSFTANNRQINGTAATGTAGSYTLTYSASDGTNATPTSVMLTVVAGSTTPPPVVTGNFEGYLSVVNCQEIRGWVWDRNKPNTPMLVEFFSDGRSIGTVEAKNFRQDLKDAQKGNGAHGYVFATPAEVKDNINHQISAKVQNSTYVLKGSPINLTCALSGGRLSAERAEELQAVLLGNPVSDQVRVEIRGAEGQPLRVQLTDVKGRLLSERQVEKAAAVELQTLPVLHPITGLLFLQIQSGSRSVTLKVLTQ